MPADEGFRKQVAGTLKGMLVAWDPVKQEPRWTVEHPGPWNGGLLATAGGLGVFKARRAASSTPMMRRPATSCGALPRRPGWSRRRSPTLSTASNMFAVLAGWGGAYALSVDGDLINRKAPVRNVSRLLVFKLGGKAALPPEPELAAIPLDPPPSRASAEVIAVGQAENMAAIPAVCCTRRGAVGSTVRPDLRRLPVRWESAQAWNAVVEGGGMLKEQRAWRAFAGIASARTRSRRSAPTSSTAPTRDKAIEGTNKVARR